MIAEHYYLNDWPVGVISNATLYYVHPDHIGTPRAVTVSGNNAPVWFWDSSLPFGGDQANANPSGLGTFSYNLRFPGQYLDAETGQHTTTSGTTTFPLGDTGKVIRLA